MPLIILLIASLSAWNKFISPCELCSLMCLLIIVCAFPVVLFVFQLCCSASVGAGQSQNLFTTVDVLKSIICITFHEISEELGRQ